MQIANNSVVSIDYTLTNDSGAVLDSSNGQPPLVYLHGGGGLIPGLEQALTGKSTGAALKVTVPPEQAYGLRDEELVQEVPHTAFAGHSVQPGMQFRAENKEGASRVVTVVGVTPQSVRIDANHPLAGQTLHFDVKVVGVRTATAEEIQHGHAHGADGHHHHH